MPAIRDGDRIVLIDRKLFRDDNTRIFVAVVEEYDDGVVRARGHSFHMSSYEIAGTERHSEERVRVISLASGDVIYLLPREVDVAKLQVRRSPKAMTLTDGQMFTVDLSEWMLRA
ncbi:MAG TPA: hypothetical protein VMV15_15195 [Candidatus Binataceae bacterium]|nr:hypothetical protein [Candidatus Binataceae bacterium]